MKEFKGTPAPWSFKEFNYYRIRYRFFITSHTGTNVCKIVRDDNDNSEEELANAKLLCAAPDLLKSLQTILSLYTGTDKPSVRATLEAQAAINKALGD